jgi:hypothetical protein
MSHSRLREIRLAKKLAGLFVIGGARAGWRAAIVATRLGLVRPGKGPRIPGRARRGKTSDGQGGTRARRASERALPALAGASAMYLLDPANGSRRRELVRNLARRLSRRPTSHAGGMP